MLRLYTESVRLRYELGSGLDAIPLLQEAVRLDTGFAMAYRAWQGVLNSYLTEWERQEELTQLAYEHRNRLTDFERLHVEANHVFFQGLRNPAMPPLDECGRWGPVTRL